MRHNTRSTKNRSQYVFLLYPQHRAFQSGISHLDFETLPTSIKSPRDGLIAGLVTLLWIALGCGFFAFGANQFALYQRFSNEARDISVEIRGCSMESAGKNDIRPKIYFRYTVDDVLHVGERMLTGPDCDAYPLRSTLSASYLPSDPTRIRFLQHLDTREQELGFYLVPACLFLATLIPIFKGIFRLKCYQRARRIYPRLQTDGELIAGTIISARYSNPGDKANLLHIRYQFVTPSNRLLKRWVTDQSLRQPPPVGTSILVLYADDKAFIML